MRTEPAFPVYPIDTLRDLLFKSCERYGTRDCLSEKASGTYQPLDFNQVRGRTEALATWFSASGLKKGDRIAVISENRVSWAITYLAAVTAGFVIVPLDRELKEAELSHILAFSGARVVVAGADYLAVVDGTGDRPKSLERVIPMDPGSGVGSGPTLDEAIADGERRIQGGDRSYSECGVHPADTAAMIFTSGTMGVAKAVRLSHGNLAANIIGTSHHVSIAANDVMLSVLPLHHTYECTAGFLTALYQGATVCYAENLRRVADNLRETRATVMLGVPALFEAMYRRIESGIREKGKRRFALARAAASVSRKLFRVDLRRRLFRQLHERFGGRLRLLISGGAAIDPTVSQGFRDLGIAFIQGYGMTEYAPIIAVNRVDWYKDDSVGLPLPHTEVKIEDGEIVVRGPCVMQGYYQNPVATREVLRDGWLYTGDLGQIDHDGFLYISGRKKSLIVTPNGKNVYPEELEALLNQSEYILESLVWGGPDNVPALTEVQAIIVPDIAAFDRLRGTAEHSDSELMETISEEVGKVNRTVASFKRIKRFTLRREEFEKTTTRKVKRYLYTGKSSPLQPR